MKIYQNIKSKYNMSPYLTSVTIPEHINILTKLQISTHCLNVEKCRYNKIIIPPVTYRICPFCPKKVENEYHFVLECDKYTNIREKLLSSISSTVPSFSNANKSQNLYVRSSTKYSITCCVLHISYV